MLSTFSILTLGLTWALVSTAKCEIQAQDPVFGPRAFDVLFPLKAQETLAGDAREKLVPAPRARAPSFIFEVFLFAFLLDS